MKRGDYVNIKAWGEDYTTWGVYVGDNLDGSVQIVAPDENQTVNKGDASSHTVVDDDDLFAHTLEVVNKIRETI